MRSLNALEILSPNVLFFISNFQVSAVILIYKSRLFKPPTPCHQLSINSHKSHLILSTFPSASPRYLSFTCTLGAICSGQLIFQSALLCNAKVNQRTQGKSTRSLREGAYFTHLILEVRFELVSWELRGNNSQHSYAVQFSE